MPEVDLEALVEADPAKPSAPNACRSICPPARAKPSSNACSTTRAKRFRYRQALPRRHSRSDRRDGRKPDGEIPRRRRAGLRRAARAVREGDGRGARRADPVHRCEERRRRARIARRDRPAFPQPEEGNPAPFLSGEGDGRKAVRIRQRSRAGRCWRTCSK